MGPQMLFGGTSGDIVRKLVGNRTDFFTSPPSVDVTFRVTSDEHERIVRGRAVQGEPLKLIQYM